MAAARSAVKLQALDVLRPTGKLGFITFAEIATWQLLSLTLKGFLGIRDGLDLEAMTLYFEAPYDGAVLVVTIGADGLDQASVLDNMHRFAEAGRAPTRGASEPRSVRPFRIICRFT